MHKRLCYLNQPDNTGSDPYMNKIHPIITTARSTLPKAQIAVIADFDGLMYAALA